MNLNLSINATSAQNFRTLPEIPTAHCYLDITLKTDSGDL